MCKRWLFRLGPVPVLLALPLLPAAPVGAQEEDAIEEIVVTGTYIRRTTADSPSPLSVVDRAEIENIGANEISDIVNRMPYNTGSTNTTNAFSGGDNSTGETNINLRNLGLGSTLVLLDGARTVAANTDSGGNAYTSTALLVPAIAIQRVEVLKDGSSALYGSDAVAGVVNFITRDDYEGVEFQAQYGADQESGNQEDLTLGGIFGVGGDRGHITLSAEYLDRQGLQIEDRYDDYGLTGVSTLGNPGTFVPTDPAVLGPYLVGGGLAAGIGQVPLAGDIDCELASSMHRQSFRAPTFGTDLAGSLDGLGACIYDFSPFFNIVGEESRFLSHATAEWNLADQHTLYGVFSFADQNFSRGNSLFPLVRFPTVPADNPGLINDFQRRSTAVTGNPNALPPVPTTFFGRVLGFTPDTDFELRPVDTDTRENIDQYRAQVGLEGTLPVGEGWTYDLSWNYTEHNSTTRNTDTVQQRLLSALNGFGGPNCFRDAPGESAGSGNAGTGECFYYNPFFSAFFEPDGTPQADPALSNPPELMDWMVGEIRTVSESWLGTANAIVSGNVMEMPAGPLGLAAGLQYRRSETRFEADDTSNANGFSFIFGARDFEATDDVYAGFLELAVPVTEAIDVQLAGRVEHFEDADETTFDPKLTAMWRVTPALTLRGSTGTSFRTGSLLQRFGQSTQLLNMSDLDFSGSGLAFRPFIATGNEALDPEEAFVYNLGFSWAPESGALEGWSLDLDWYSYEYDDLVTRLGPENLISQDIASRCPQGIDDDPTNDIPDCGPQRDAEGDITEVISVGPGIPQVVRAGPEDDFSLLRIESPFINAQELQTSGIDTTIGYEWTSDAIGTVRTRLQGTWTNEYELTLPDGSTIDGVGQRNATNTVGRSLPEFKANMSVNWLRGRHGVYVLFRYIDSYTDDQPFDDPDGDGDPDCVGSCLRAVSAGFDLMDREVDSWFSVDAQYSFELPAFGPQAEGSTISIGGINVFNETPPEVNFDGGFDPFVHDPRGAVWYARYRMML